ncbi:MAG: CHASE domain-containing sensor histidine kinase [Microthrixaceae bacterium]
MSSRPSRRHWWLTAAVVLIGMTATIGSSAGFAQSIQRDRDRRLDAAAARARGAVSERLRLHTEDLAHLRNWLLLNPGASRADFHQFTTLGLEEGLYPRVQALSMVPRVARDDRDRFLADIRAELAGQTGFPPFVITPETTGDTSYPVTYIEPIAGNEAALGFDLASDPVRLETIETARDRGGAVGTGPVRLRQETGDQTGFVLISPIYDTQDVPATGPARRRHFIGIASMVLRVGDMFTGVLGEDPEVDAEMYDVGPTVDPPEMRYDESTRLLNTKPNVVVRADGTVPGTYRDLDLNIGDRRWRMVLTPAAGFSKGSEQLPWVVALLGTLITLLLAAIVHTSASARRRAERRALAMTADLRSAEERTRSIIQGAPDAMLVVDADGRIVTANLATEALFDYSAADLEGKPIEVLLPEDLGEIHRQHRAGYATAPRRREMGADLELLGRTRYGETFPVEVSLSPLLTSDGALEVIAAVRDVSDRRAAQAALQDAYDHERAAAEHLREANELKTAFLNTISHELRTPLTAIAGFTDLLLGAPLTEEQRTDYLHRVRRNANSLSTLISDVLAFARLDRGDAAMNPVELDLAEEVPLVLDQLAPLLQGFSVATELHGPARTIIDREALTRILTNLVTNAARYAPEGTTVTVAVEQRAGEAVLSVTDEGPGIPADERAHIFERFFRGATALASRVPGTGIGLAVVSELAERAGGGVEVSAPDGGGARFEVTLPGVDRG